MKLEDVLNFNTGDAVEYRPESGHERLNCEIVTTSKMFSLIKDIDSNQIIEVGRHALQRPAKELAGEFDSLAQENSDKVIRFDEIALHPRSGQEAIILESDNEGKDLVLLFKDGLVETYDREGREDRVDGMFYEN